MTPSAGAPATDVVAVDYNMYKLQISDKCQIDFSSMNYGSGRSS